MSQNGLDTSGWLWKWRSTETTLFLMITWIGYFIGAASSGAALFLSRSAAAAIPLALVLIVVLYIAMKQLRKNGHN